MEYVGDKNDQVASHAAFCIFIRVLSELKSGKIRSIPTMQEK